MMMCSGVYDKMREGWGFVSRTYTRTGTSNALILQQRIKVAATDFFLCLAATAATIKKIWM